jgi:bilirubin oxidase
VGEYKDYYYPNGQAARTLWYHDHAEHITAQNAYFGQAGFYILHDPAEDVLGLPSGKYDIPLGLSSKQYNSDGTLFDPINEIVSLYGDVIHVNGQPWPYLTVEPRKYRFRFLDSAISRTFQLYFESVTTAKKVNFQVIASDAGLIAHPITTDNLYISMAERWEVIVDFAAFKGQSVDLKNMRDVGADEDYAATDKVMRFNVLTAVTDNTNNAGPPATLRTVPMPASKTQVDQKFKFERKNGQWTINGVTFSDIENRILAKPDRGSLQVWELENGSGGWSHPIHIHLIDFRIISRVGGKRGIQSYEAEALKDVVWLGPNEKVTVLAQYAPWDGVYMFHCHNLIHEDHDMMGAFNVSSLPNWGYTDRTKFLDPMEVRFLRRLCTLIFQN